MEAFKGADPVDKAQAYSRLDATLTYHPNEKRVAAEARLASIMYVGACPRIETYLREQAARTIQAMAAIYD
jgi:hypothetical protein